MFSGIWGLMLWPFFGQIWLSMRVFPMNDAGLLAVKEKKHQWYNRVFVRSKTISNHLWHATTYVIKQVWLHSFGMWKKRTKVRCIHTYSVKRQKRYRCVGSGSLNVLVETIMRVLFVWSFMVIIVQLYHRGESNALSRPLCWIICSRSKYTFSIHRQQKTLSSSSAECKKLYRK